MWRRITGCICVVSRPVFARPTRYHASITERLAKRIPDCLSASLIETPVRVSIIYHADKLSSGAEDAVTFVNGTLQITRVVQAPYRIDEIKARIGDIGCQTGSQSCLPTQLSLLQAVVGHPDWARGDV